MQMLLHLGSMAGDRRVTISNLRFKSLSASHEELATCKTTKLAAMLEKKDFEAIIGSAAQRLLTLGRKGINPKRTYSVILLKINEFTRIVFALDSRIRYIAIVDRSYHLLLSKMRDGVMTMTSEEIDQNFMPIVPPIVMEAVEKLQQFLGKARTVLIRYDKLVHIYLRLQNYIIILSCEGEVETPFQSKVEEAIKQLTLETP